MVAELAVYLPGLGTVVRCRSCDSVLMVFVSLHGTTCTDLMGLASLSYAGQWSRRDSGEASVRKCA